MRLNRTSAASLRTPAFSLVELLVVIGIISLLIGIALPAFSRVKESARVAVTSGAISSISTGTDMFRADQRLGGEYPPSTYFHESQSGHLKLANPHVRPLKYNCNVGGASLIVWALAGADLQGTPGFLDLNASDPGAGSFLAGLAPWADDTHYGTNGLYERQGSTSLPARARSTFVDVSKMKFPKNLSDGNTSRFQVPSATNANDALGSYCFLDAWDRPILYYRANPLRPWTVSNQTPAQAADPKSAGAAGVYNLKDNINIAGLGTGIDFGGSTRHFLSEDTSNPLGERSGIKTQTSPLPGRHSFGWTIYNPSASVWAPHNPETYILLSAGPDGMFGTEDDVANFPVNK